MVDLLSRRLSHHGHLLLRLLLTSWPNLHSRATSKDQVWKIRREWNHVTERFDRRLFLGAGRKTCQMTKVKKLLVVKKLRVTKKWRGRLSA